jgi:moderate conductance mechanosensitive channel
MSRRSLPFIALALTVLLAAAPAVVAVAQTPAPPAPSPRPLTSDEARRALDTLQDDARRAQVIDALRTVANAGPAQAAPSDQRTAPPTSEGLGAQLLLQFSEQLGDMSHAFAAAVRTLTDFPLLWRWLVGTASDPFARDTLVDITWKLMLVLGGALAAEWLILRALRRPSAMLEARVPSLPHHHDDDRATGSSPVASPPAEPAIRRRHFNLTRTWRFLVRLPFVIARLVLDLLPVFAFAAVGTLLLGTQLGDAGTPRLVILAIVNAYVLCRGAMCVARTLVSPNPLSLLTIRGETAAYVEIWTRRIVTVGVFGVALANVALLLGLYRPGYEALVRLVMLTIHLFVVVIILQCRRPVAQFVRSADGSRGMLAVMRGRAADSWHYVAIAVVMAVWAVWAFNVRNGYALLLQYFVGTAVVVMAARLASIVILGTIDRVFRINPDFLRRFPGLEARANRYLPLLRGTVSGIIFAIAVVALLEVWGVNAIVWFYGGQIGSRVLSAVVTIGIAALAASAIWEASNALIERHLARLTREMQFVRAARLRTFLPMLRTALLYVIVAVVALTALSEIGVNVAPLLAGAGIVGIAIGFGSQKLVQDVITGLFLLLENVVQVGDNVTVSGLSGTVENLSIRTIRLRAGDGSVHIVPFSAVTSVTNTNRGIGNAAVAVNVPYKEDTDRVGQALREIAAEMRRDPDYRHLIRGDLDLWGVDKVDGSMASVVGQIECTDAGRWPVQREFNRRMKRRFQELGIEIARSSQTIVVQLPSAAEGDAGPARRRSSRS